MGEAADALVNGAQDLEKRMTVLQGEVNGLQVAVAEKRRPFYKDPSTLISVMALFLSFGTTYLSNSRVATQDIENKRQELRGLLQRMAALPKENVDVAKKYGDDPAAQAMVSGYINQENALLTRQAAEVAKALPNGTVSAIEYYAIGLALQNAYDLSGAKEFVTLAIQNASDFNTEISARRMLANLAFIAGDVESGRREYESALQIFLRYRSFDAYTVALTNVLTELNWANSEFGTRRTAEVVRHIENAERIASGVPPSPAAETMLAQVRQAKQTYARSGVGTNLSPGGLRPSPATGPLQLPDALR